MKTAAKISWLAAVLLVLAACSVKQERSGEPLQQAEAPFPQPSVSGPDNETTPEEAAASLRSGLDNYRRNQKEQKAEEEQERMRIQEDIAHAEEQ